MKLITHKINQNSNTSKAIVALHGWTGDEFVFDPIAKMLNIKQAQWFIPRAPYKADNQNGNTWFGGNEKSGWRYKKTMTGLEYLVDDIIQEGYSKENIFILGFSQGATLAIEFGLRLPFSIGGIIPIAGFIKFKNKLIEENSPASLKTKILLLHGSDDKIVPVNESYTSLDVLKGMGYKATLEEYKAGHKIPISCHRFIRKFIGK